jgi:two-component system response regulator DesR
MEKTAASNKANDRRIRVIVADDSPEFLKSFCGFLEALPDVNLLGSVANGHEAVSLAETHTADLVILDVEMPVLNGLAAAAIFRERFAGLRVMLVSINDSQVWRGLCSSGGVDAFVPKQRLARELPVLLRKLFPAAGPLPVVSDSVIGPVNGEVLQKNKTL